eukprot:SAG11_NODE_5494_length_1545_cov_1.200553_2_plen_357_part_01
MSTTASEEIALGYSKCYGDNQPSTVFTAKMNATSRGAFIGWLSQYPLEKEFLYSPLCCMEVNDNGVMKDGVIHMAMSFHQNNEKVQFKASASQIEQRAFNGQAAREPEAAQRSAPSGPKESSTPEPSDREVELALQLEEMARRYAESQVVAEERKRDKTEREERRLRDERRLREQAEAKLREEERRMEAEMQERERIHADELAKQVEALHEQRHKNEEALNQAREAALAAQQQAADAMQNAKTEAERAEARHAEEQARQRAMEAEAEQKRQQDESARQAAQAHERAMLAKQEAEQRARRAAEVQSTGAWVKKGVKATYDGRLGTVTMPPDSDKEVKLRWSEGGTSGCIKIVNLVPAD